MPIFEIAGPGPKGDYRVVRADTVRDVTHYTTLPEPYPTADEAQTAADTFNSYSESVPNV